MGEGHVQKFISDLRSRLILILIGTGLFMLGLHLVLIYFTPLSVLLTAIILGVVWLSVAILIGFMVTPTITKPTEFIAQSILHVSPSEHLVAAPNIDKLNFGRELAESLARQVYDFAAVAQHSAPEKQASLSPNAFCDQLPVAVFGLDEKSTIKLANKKARAVLRTEELIGHHLKDKLMLLSEDEVSIGSWLQNTRQTSLTDSKTWQKVEAKTIDNSPMGYFDIAVSFNKHSASGIETVLILFDHSEDYKQEEDAINFVSLAVHEMRTPVTILRGYIEAFEDEIGSNASPQIKEDLQKMNASAENLTTFMSNILNVARIDQGQLTLSLQQANWNDALPQIIDNLRNRAGVYGKNIELRMQPNMPLAAIDRMTIAEVMTNLIENAIKYSPDNAKDIQVISRINQDGLIETTVQDHGLGITSSVMPHLFSKFQRNHRNQAQIGGTGLGLFLCKSIITAHNGNIWVKSKEGEGSTFGFTLQPFEQLAKGQQVNHNETIVRGSHGWIKNHTMQRR